jgi:hypothetical protein
MAIASLRGVPAHISRHVGCAHMGVCIMCYAITELLTPDMQSHRRRRACLGRGILIYCIHDEAQRVCLFFESLKGKMREKREREARERSADHAAQFGFKKSEVSGLFLHNLCRETPIFQWNYDFLYIRKLKVVCSGMHNDMNMNEWMNTKTEFLKRMQHSHTHEHINACKEPPSNDSDLIHGLLYLDKNHRGIIKNMDWISPPYPYIIPR